MSNDELFLRQQRLLARSSELRIQLQSTAQVFKKPLSAVDRTQAALQWLYRNPQWPLGSLLVLAILRPRRSIIWANRAWRAWKLYTRAKIWINAQPLQGIFVKSN